MASKTLAESPRAALALTPAEELAFPQEQLRVGSWRSRPKPLAYNVLVEDVMTRDVVSVSRSSTLMQAALLMHRRHITGLPVVAGKGRLVGVVTETDITRTLGQGTGLTPLGAMVRGFRRGTRASGGNVLDRFREILTKSRVGGAMTPDPVAIGPKETVERASEAMVEHKVNRLPVVVGHRLVGIIAREDIVRACLPKGPA